MSQRRVTVLLKKTVVRRVAAPTDVESVADVEPAAAPTAIAVRPPVSAQIERLRAIPSPDDVLERFLAARSSPDTRKAYAADMASFGRFLGTDADGAVAELLRCDAGQANRLALGWLTSIAHEAPATRSRRIGTLRSFAKMGRTLGLVSWHIEIESPRVKKLRDTRGPGMPAVEKLLAAPGPEHGFAGDGVLQKRDRAILGLFSTAGLRRAEVAKLDVGHFDVENNGLWILSKGKQEREWYPIASATAETLHEWLRAIGGRSAEAPLFCALDRGHRGQRLKREGLNKILHRVADRASVDRKRIRPHALRHFFGTHARQRGHDIGDVQAAMRHASPETTMRYDDNLRERGRGVVDDLGEELLGERK